MQNNTYQKQDSSTVLITNFSQKATLHRYWGRLTVDRLFEERDKEVFTNGKRMYKHSRKERERIDSEARLFWKTIICEAEKL